MPFSSTLPAVAGLSILGAALGITLGRDAVAEINPSYFNEKDDSFHAALVPYRSSDWAQVQQADYRAAQQPVLVGQLGTGCAGCADYPIAYVPRHDPAVDEYVETRVETVAIQPVQMAVAQTPAPDPAREQIQAYSTYPVGGEEKPVEVAEAPAEEAAAPTGL